MNKCIVLGIDAPISPATRQAIRTIKELMEPLGPQFRLIVLHVIPTPYVTSPTLGLYTAQLQASAATADQRLEAEKLLATVRKMFQEEASLSLLIESCIRQGSPADEIIKVASEVHADLIVVGSRGNGARAQVRRFFLGSKSRRVLHGTTCPVMIVSLPPFKRPADLVVWYEEAITRYLHEHPGGLTVFTPAQVAQLFAPPKTRNTSERHERAAAILALEHLAKTGVLCRHDIKGEMRYVND